MACMEKQGTPGSGPSWTMSWCGLEYLSANHEMPNRLDISKWRASSSRLALQILLTLRVNCRDMFVNEWLFIPGRIMAKLSSLSLLQLAASYHKLRIGHSRSDYTGTVSHHRIELKFNVLAINSKVLSDHRKVSWWRLMCK